MSFDIQGDLLRLGIWTPKNIPIKHLLRRYLDVWRSCKQQKGRKIKWIYMFILGFVGFGISRPLPVAVEKFPAEGQYLQTVSFPGRPVPWEGAPIPTLPSWLEWKPLMHGHKTRSRFTSQRYSEDVLLCWSRSSFLLERKTTKFFGNIFWMQVT